MNKLIIIAIIVFLGSLFIYNAVVGEYYAGNTTVYAVQPFQPYDEYICQSGGPIGVNMCNYA